MATAPTTSPYAPKAQHPVYGNAGSSSGYTANTTVSSAPYSLTASSPISSTIYLKPSAKPIGEMGYKNGEIYLVINTKDGAKDLKLTFQPEANLTTNDLLQVTLLGLLLTNNGMQYSENALEFVRNHSLERHFKFEEA